MNEHIWIRRENDADNMHIKLTESPQVAFECTDGICNLVLEFTNTINMPHYLSWGLGDVDRTPENVDILITLTLKNAIDLVDLINYAVKFSREQENQK